MTVHAASTCSPSRWCTPSSTKGLFFLFLFSLTSTIAGGCAPDPCDGDNVWIGNAHIRTQDDLAALDGIVCIAGSLLIGEIAHDPSKTGSGVQGLELSAELTHVDGLEAIVVVEGDLQIAGNNVLVSLEGLKNVTAAGRELRISDWPRADLILHQNATLQRLDGLDSLDLVGANAIISSNTALVDLTGMRSLSRVGWEFRVVNNESLETADIQAYAEQVHAMGGKNISGNGGAGGGG